MADVIVDLARRLPCQVFPGAISVIDGVAVPIMAAQILRPSFEP